MKHFPEENELFPLHKYLVAHSTGFGLCDFNSVKRICKIIPQKLQGGKVFEDTCPLTSDKIHSKMGSGLLHETYNAI